MIVYSFQNLLQMIKKNLEKKKLEEQIEKIERGEEELTPWEDIRAELGLDDKADSLDS